MLAGLILLLAGAGVMSVAAAQTEAPGRTTDGILRPPDKPAAPLVRAVEIGAGYGRYSDDIGYADGEFVRFSLSRPWRYTLTLDGGRESRFGETSWDYGITYTRFLPRLINLSAGISSGTGEFLAPRYRLGLSASASPFGIVTTLGYLRIQSKGENSSDGLGLGLMRYTGHWIFGVSARGDIGQPGDTFSSSAGVGITYYVWRKTYIGATADWGDVSYMLIGVGRAEVDFYSRAFTIGLSQWFTARSGANVRASYGETSFYHVKGITVSLFQEF